MPLPWRTFFLLLPPPPYLYLMLSPPAPQSDPYHNAQQKIGYIQADHIAFNKKSLPS